MLKNMANRGGADDALAQHGERHHGLVADAPLVQKKQDERDGRAAQQADDGRTAPRVLVAAELQRQQEHDGRGADEQEAREVE